MGEVTARPFDPEKLLREMRDIVRESVACVVRPQIESALRGTGHAGFGEVKAEGHYDGKDYVTLIDKDNEKFLLNALSKRLPSAFATGEESFEADFDANIARLKTGHSWIVDPLDGTNNVTRSIKGETKGAPGYGVMVALLEEGVPVAAVIYYNHAGAEEGIVYGGFGLGAFRQDFGNLADIRTLSLRGGLPEGVAQNSVITTVPSWPKMYRGVVQGNIDAGHVCVFDPPPKSAAVESALFLMGRVAGAAFRQFRHWDHDPVLVLAREAGGHAAFLNNEPFDVAHQRRKGLLAARSESEWQALRHALLGDVSYDHTADS